MEARAWQLQGAGGGLFCSCWSVGRAIRPSPQLDWRKIEQDLGAMMRNAKSMKKKGNLIDAALIAGYVMTITCREFKHDYLAYTPARYDMWAEKNKVSVQKRILSEMGLKTHRQNLANYADKGYEILKLVLPALKDRALAPGSNVNVDETWERFQTHFGHRKTYMWCLVNRKANIVIFFYEDTVDKYGNQKSGGRNRAVLKDFLGDAKLKSLQSDGYICYMYLDDDLIDIEHLCCLAHVRAKLERAERMGCKEASSPMSLVRKLYKREDLYVEKGYDAEKIKEMRNDEYTRGIVDKLQNEMFDLMANKMDKLPKLMQQALNYLHKFWKQVFAYRNDGEYSIDNLAAERAIRPQTIQRKGSLFFGSVQGALRSAMYNTFIQTCKQVGVSFRQYFNALLKAVKSGRTDYENLLPMTICLD